jgi:hypothetical protein
MYRFSFYMGDDMQVLFAVAVFHDIFQNENEMTGDTGRLRQGDFADGAGSQA